MGGDGGMGGLQQNGPRYLEAEMGCMCSSWCEDGAAQSQAIGGTVDVLLHSLD